MLVCGASVLLQANARMTLTTVPEGFVTGCSDVKVDGGNPSFVARLVLTIAAIS